MTAALIAVGIRPMTMGTSTSEFSAALPYPRMKSTGVPSSSCAHGRRYNRRACSQEGQRRHSQPSVNSAHFAETRLLHSCFNFADGLERAARPLHQERHLWGGGWQSPSAGDRCCVARQVTPALTRRQGPFDAQARTLNPVAVLSTFWGRANGRFWPARRTGEAPLSQNQHRHGPALTEDRGCGALGQASPLNVIVDAHW